MKLCFASLATFSLLITACNEPQPKPIRPSIDPATDPQEKLPPTRPQGDDTQPAPSTPPIPPEPPAPPAPSACPSNNTCKTFTAKEISLCKLYGGGDTICNSNRWNTEFYTSIASAIALGRTTCTVTTTMNLRGEPAFADENIITTIPTGTVIEKMSGTNETCNGQSGSFFNVKWGTKEGFVCSSWLNCL
jgi:hypothetical protein